MKATAVLTGLALALTACGGGSEPASEQPVEQAPAAAPAATGATHDVNMVLEGTAYKYVPSQLTIKSGDVVVFHNISGGPHNVDFYADSIPAGAADVLGAAMQDRMGPLSGPLIVEPNATYSISFAGAPAGEYKFFCLPHQALGMTGSLIVQ